MKVNDVYLQTVARLVFCEAEVRIAPSAPWLSVVPLHVHFESAHYWLTDFGSWTGRAWSWNDGLAPGPVGAAAPRL